MKHTCTVWLFRVRKQTWPTRVAKSLVVLGHRGGKTEVKGTCDGLWGFWLLYFLSCRLVQGLFSELHMLNSETFPKAVILQWKRWRQALLTYSSCVHEPEAWRWRVWDYPTESYSLTVVWFTQQDLASTKHNSYRLETTQIPINGWMEKLCSRIKRNELWICATGWLWLRRWLSH